MAQGSPATISGHLTFVAPGRQRTTNKSHRSKKRTLRPTTSRIKMAIAVILLCARDSANVAQCWDIDRKERLRHQRAAGLMVTFTTQARQIRAEPPTRTISKVREARAQRCGDDAGLSSVNPQGRTDLRGMTTPCSCRHDFHKDPASTVGLNLSLEIIYTKNTGTDYRRRRC